MGFGRVYRSVGTASPETGHRVGIKSVEPKDTPDRVRSAGLMIRPIGLPDMIGEVLIRLR